ncbi:MAG: hypothetical protein QW327_02520, partial [Candidatus Odinarchaeota archaeon]
ITRRGGPPGRNLIDKIFTPPGYIIISASFGPIPTKTILSREIIFEDINLHGGKCIRKLLFSPSIDNFLKLSRDFVEKTGLLTSRVSEVLEKLDKINVASSMCMIGETVFTIVKESVKSSVISVMEKFFEKNRIISTPINNTGLLVYW